MKTNLMPLDKDEIRRLQAEENLIIDAQFLIQSLMNEKNMTKADVAKTLGLSKARLSQIMGTNSNLTLRVLARIIDALGESVEIKKAEKGVKIKEEPVSDRRYATPYVLERLSWKIEAIDVSCCNDVDFDVDLKAA